MPAESLLNEKQKLRQIFNFLKSFDALQKPVARQIEQNVEVIDLSSIPQNPSLHLNLEDNRIFRVCKPNRPSTIPCPTPSQSLHSCLEPGWENPENDPELVDAVEDPELLEALQRWTNERTTWKRTALEELERYKVADHYFKRAFHIYTSLRKDGEELELVLADVILTCPGTNYPLIFQKLEIDLDDDTSEFQFELSLDSPSLNEVLLNETAEIKENIPRCAALLRSKTLYPITQEVIEAGDEITRKLFPDTGEFFPDKTLVEERPGATRIVHRPYILLRKKIEGYGQVVTKILEHVALANELPSHLLQITGLRHRKLHEAADNEGSMGNPSPQLSQVYLSKETNQEQVRIALALEKSSGVLVQGPPGTGKTHTIANLVGHLLSQGKTVLITAQTSKALNVLRDKIAESLRALCISVLDKDTSKLTSQAATDFVTTLNRTEPAANLKRADTLEKHRQELFSRQRTLKSELKAAKLADQRPIVLDGRTHRPLDLAKTIAANLDYQWVRTPVPMDRPLPLSLHEIEELYYTNQTISRDAEEQLAADLPSLQELISPEDFTLARSQTVSGSPPVADQREQAQALIKLIQEEKQRTSNFSDWQIALIRKTANPQQQSLWEAFLEQTKHLRAKIEEASAARIEHDIQLPPESEFELLQSTLAEIHVHLNSGKNLGFFTRLTKPRWARTIDSVKIDGKPAGAKAKLQKILSVVEAKTMLVSWTTRAQKQFEAIQTPLPHPVANEEDLAHLEESVATALSWRTQQWGKIIAGLDTLTIDWQNIPIQNNHLPKELLLCREPILLGLVVQALETYRIAAARAQLETSKALLHSHLQSPIGARLLRALEAKDRNAYDQGYQELRKLSDLAPIYERRKTILDKLVSIAPAWRTDIVSRMAPHQGPAVPPDPQKAWPFAQFRQALEELELLSPEMLEQQLTDVNRQIRKVTSEIVELRTWAQQKRKVTTEHTQALAAFTTTLAKIGKGTGKMAVQKQREAQAYLRQGKEAFPVWIMPLSRVYQSFDPSTTKFDVVIIDEASQSDLRALAAIYMAKQIVIVGDKEQVTPRYTPGAQGIPALQSLIATHLQDIPNKTLYEGSTSIYELVEGSFETIPLREHFRCVPPIIHFCSDLSYNNSLVPLRDPQSSPIAQPLVPYHVKDAYKHKHEKVNEVEADQIVALLLKCLADPKYDLNDLKESTSYGVISLGGVEQARLIDAKLHEAVSPAEFKKRSIICGEPYDLQGDERDIIFLSLVDSGDSIIKKTEEGHNARERRKFNVAVSRARNQLWIVYSMDPENDLQSDDIRYKLIRYAQDPEAVEVKIARAREEAGSVFEEEVQAFLIQKGYRVEPQYKVGGRFIDIVVSDGNKKLAVECDGERWHGEDKLEEDLERQSVLERMGWKFHRIRGISYFRNRNKELQRLIDNLEKRNIRPSNSR